MKCTGEPVKSFSVHDFFLKQDEADVYWHVYSLLALREKSWTEKLFTGSPVHFTVPISPVVNSNYILTQKDMLILTIHISQYIHCSGYVYLILLYFQEGRRWVVGTKALGKRGPTKCRYVLLLLPRML